jgi:acyl phosphate:glycerol-3-phosphate acyltransferase
MEQALWVVGAYLLGAIPTSYLVARVFAGVDLRQYGSKNLGATNLYRLLGFKAAIPTALFDILKGVFPVFYAHLQLDPHPGVWPLVLGFAAVVGHVFSPFVRFKGGKGVATAAGVFLALTPWSLLLGLGVWIVTVALTRYVSLGSMLAAVALAVSVPFLHPGYPDVFVAAVVVALFIVFTHRANLKRLLAGNESKIGARQRPPGEATA